MENIYTENKILTINENETCLFVKHSRLKYSAAIKCYICKLILWSMLFPLLEILIVICLYRYPVFDTIVIY